MSAVGRCQLGSSRLPTLMPTTSVAAESLLNKGEPQFGQKLRLTWFPLSPVTV
jgi:hypothetical protein